MKITNYKVEYRLKDGPGDKEWKLLQYYDSHEEAIQAKENLTDPENKITWFGVEYRAMEWDNFFEKYIQIFF